MPYTATLLTNLCHIMECKTLCAKLKKKIAWKLRKLYIIKEFFCSHKWKQYIYGTEICTKCAKKRDDDVELY